jgi:hypothetical protein
LNGEPIDQFSILSHSISAIQENDWVSLGHSREMLDDLYVHPKFFNQRGIDKRNLPSYYPTSTTAFTNNEKKLLNFIVTEKQTAGKYNNWTSKAVLYNDLVKLNRAINNSIDLYERNSKQLEQRWKDQKKIEKKKHQSTIVEA